MKMKTLLGFALLVLYTFSMLAWGGAASAQVCGHVAPAAHHLIPLPCPDTSDPALK